MSFLGSEKDIIDTTEKFPENKSLWNEDIAPVPSKNRNWGYLAYIASWTSTINAIPIAIGGSLIVLGLPLILGIITVIVANLVLYFMLIIQSHAGTKYGIAEPQTMRTRFGVYGAWVPSFIRGVVALGWFGIQTYVFTEIADGFYFLATGRETELINIASSGPSAMFKANPTVFVVSFALVLLAQAGLVYFSRILRQQATVRRLFIANIPIAFAGMLILLFATLSKIGFNFGTLALSDISIAPGFTIPLLILLGLNSILGSFITMTITMPDLTRFAKSNKLQVLSQSMIIPFNTFAMVAGMIIVAATPHIFGVATYDGILIATILNIPIALKVLILVLFGYMTFVINVQANLIPPAYDFSNFWPGKLTFKRGVIITSILTIVMQTWVVYGNAESFLEGWLGYLSGFLGAVVGVAVIDYALIRRFRFPVAEIFKPKGYFTYWHGINPAAIIAIAVTYLIVFAPIPGHKTIALIPGYIAIALGALLYYLMMRFWIVPRYQPDILKSKTLRATSAAKK